MKRLIYAIILCIVFVACGQSYEETKRLSRLERQKQLRADSAALKIAVLPTLDCSPLFVAKDLNLFDSLGADIRLKYFSSQIDCDTALINKRVEGAVTDLVRMERIRRAGHDIFYSTATNAYWILLSNRNSRIKELKQLDDKMMAMTRYSVTDLLGEHAVDSVKLEQDKVYRVQINDVRIRLSMLKNNEMDALLLPEPQATEAIAEKHKVLMDSRKLDWQMGVVAFRNIIANDTLRQRQYDVFVKAYNMACDSINRYGVKHYKLLVTKYCQVKASTVDILKPLKYNHVAPPRDKDVEMARRWMEKKERELKKINNPGL